MKKITFILALFVSLESNGQFGIQRKDEYKATNGITYHEGDKVKLGMGSGINGTFAYIKSSGIANNNQPAPSQYFNTTVVVKKLKEYNSKTYLAVEAQGMLNYMIDIEGAIASCEIVDCKKNEPTEMKADKYERLKKLKELLDSGAITQEEYDKEKKKILDQGQ